MPNLLAVLNNVKNKFLGLFSPHPLAPMGPQKPPPMSSWDQYQATMARLDRDQQSLNATPAGQANKTLTTYWKQQDLANAASQKPNGPFTAAHPVTADPGSSLVQASANPIGPQRPPQVSDYTGNRISTPAPIDSSLLMQALPLLFGSGQPQQTFKPVQPSTGADMSGSIAGENYLKSILPSSYGNVTTSSSFPSGMI